MGSFTTLRLRSGLASTRRARRNYVLRVSLVSIVLTVVIALFFAVDLHSAFATISLQEPENDSTILARHKHEVRVEYALEEFSDHSFNANLPEHAIDSILNGRNISVNDSRVIYSPDSAFKIFLVRGEECEAHCNTFCESWLHFNDGSGMALADAGFGEVQRIEIMPDGKYLVYEQSSERSGAYRIEELSVKLLSIENHSLKYFNLPATPSIALNTDEEESFSFRVNQPNFVNSDLKLSLNDSARLNYQYAEDVGMGYSGDSVRVYSGYFEYEAGQFIHKKEESQRIKLIYK
jgi:hypothetical protein